MYHVFRDGGYNSYGVDGEGNECGELDACDWETGVGVVGWGMMQRYRCGGIGGSERGGA